MFPRLWTHGTQDGPRKNILYDLRGGWNSAGFDNVSVNWRALEHVFSPSVSTGEEETRYEEHRGLKHGEYGCTVWTGLNGGDRVFWRVYLLLLREMVVF